MFKAQLQLEHSTLELGADTLATLINSLPEHRGMAEVYEELAGHPCAKIREAIAFKSSLTDEAVRLLAQDKSHAVIIALINNDAANLRIPAYRIDELIATDDSETLQTIFQNLQAMRQKINQLNENK